MKVTMDTHDVVPTYHFEPQEEIQATNFTELQEAFFKQQILEAQETVLGLTFLGSDDEVKLQLRLHASLQGRIDAFTGLLAASKEAKLQLSLL